MTDTSNSLNEILKKTQKFYQAGQLTTSIERALFNDDLERVKDNLTSGCYPLLSSKEKDQYVFYCIYSKYIEFDENDNKFLKYMIFEYNISEENSIANIPDLNDKVKAMFELRKVNEDLNAELDVVNGKNRKSVKV